MNKVIQSFFIISLGVGIFCFVLQGTGFLLVQSLTSFGHIIGITFFYLIYIRSTTEFKILPKENSFLTFSVILFCYFIFTAYFSYIGLQNQVVKTSSLSKSKTLLLNKLKTLPPIDFKIKSPSPDNADLVDYEDEYFSISLPTNWTPIPANELKQKTSSIVKEGVQFNYRYGFHYNQPSDKINLNWFYYPYILIFIDVTGKVPEKEMLDGIANHWDVISEFAEKSVESSLKGESHGIEFNRPTFDKHKHILLHRSETNREEAGSFYKVSSIHGVHYTEFGSISISCHTVKGVKGITDKCLSIISSIKVKEEFKFRSYT